MKPSWFTGAPVAGVNNQRRFRAISGKRGNPEHKIQVALCDYFAIAKRDDAHMFAIPNQSNRHIANAAKMKAEGVRAGTPDLCVMMAGGAVAWLEMKAPNGTLSPAQKWFRDLCGRLGHQWGVAHSVEEALVLLTKWGALKDAYCVAPSAEAAA